MEPRTGGLTSELVAQTRPAGTVTFLFTDIEGSTSRWDRFGDAMQAAVRRHDAILRAAIDAHNGHVFKTMGDAFYAVFSRAEEALAAAIAIQQEIARADFSAVDGLFVRAALHTGTADERDDDYFGPALNAVARILAIAHGEQTVVSEVTSALVRAWLPPDVQLRDLGEQRLKDIARPERVFQVVVPGLRSDFPPLRTPEATRGGNLPAPLTSFVGRATEVAEIGDLLQRCRLITLTGMGGVGKTRLSIEAARTFADRYPDGAWSVELAPLSDPALASARVGEVFGMREQIGTVMNEAWITALDRKRALLILDNCEHMIEAIALVAQRILERCPSIAILATSREPLRLSGEHVMRIAPLPLPDVAPGALPSIDELRSAPAVRLFLERAEGGGTTAAMRDDESALRSLVAICTRLDGIPLAIELAAARVNMLGLRGLEQRLDDRFRLLAGGPRTALPRQQTLRALIDWSYDLLPEAEQRVFRRLAIFAGGWTLEGAQAVCIDDRDAAAASTLDDWAVFETLSSLVDKSLVVVDADGDATRYTFLETTRAYALERLAASDEAPRVAAAHARFALSLAQHAAPLAASATERTWIDAFEADLDNIRAALEWALIAKHDVVLGASIVQTLDFTFESLGLYHEGLQWSERALAALSPGRLPPLEAALAIGVAKFHTFIGSPAGCVDNAARAVKILRSLNKPKMLGIALGFQGFGSYYLDRRAESDVYASEALEIARASGDPALLAWALCVKSWTVPPDALALRRELLAEAVVLFATLPGQPRVELAFQALSEVEFAAGDYARALAYAREGAAPTRRAGPTEGLANWCLTASASAAFAAGDIATARSDARDALSYGRRRGSGRFVGASVGLLAGVAAVSGATTVAAQLFGASEAQFVAIGRLRMLPEEYVHDRTLAILSDALPADEFNALRDQGRRWSIEQAVEAALSV